MMMPARATFGHNYPAGNDHREEKLSVYNRKAPYHFGWDWGIRIVQMGIWKPVSLTFYDKARIDDFHVKQQSVTQERASIENQIEVYSLIDTPATLTVGYSFDTKVAKSFNKESRNQLETVGKDVMLKKGKNVIPIEMVIDNPNLWMPTGWGAQHLYDFFVTLQVGNQVVDQKEEKIGLRSVRLVQEKDLHGRTFYFEVNGIPLFAKGANYIPGEIFTTQQSGAYYDRLFDNILSANMNFVRVWGGGIYENEEFYHHADEKGILVWQDFIFGCVPYPSDDAFLANVREEVIYNIKRLRNHASLAFWCGNNEVEEGLRHWGWQSQYPRR